MYATKRTVVEADDVATSGNASRARAKQSGRARHRPRSRAAKNPLLADLIRVLTLEQLERDLFRGESRDIGAPQVFGGQVIAQALVAACATVKERSVHSLHAYFLRRGDVTAPIIYQVERPRDGASFSSRRVSATQHGEEILHMSVSFQSAEQGFEHQFNMPWVAPPEDLPSARVLAENTCAHMPAKLRNLVAREKPFEFRFADPLHFMPGVGAQCVQHLWFRAVGRLADDTGLHQRLLAYASDYYLLSTATRPHDLDPGSEASLAISIDHAIWFHRPARIDEWLLYSIDSPSASGARGFTRANIFARDGRLIASTAQEGLMRARAVSRAPLGSST
jgi:acyl-CoA thioesterase II